MNFTTNDNAIGRWVAGLGIALLVGCGGGGSGTPIAEVVCRGDGVVAGGTVTFVKRLYDQQGLTGARVIKPVRYALVELVLEANGQIVGSTYTDASGNYCLVVGGFQADLPPSVYPRVATRTDPRHVRIAVVNDIASFPPNLYSYTGAPFNGRQVGTHKRDLAIPVVVNLATNAEFPLAGAFNILDVATHGAEVATGLAGRPPGAELLVGWTPGTVYGDGTVGTYFVGDDPTQTLAGIELSGGSGGGPDEGDHDEYDDDVILHEFGHFMAYSFSKPAEAGGAHYLNDNTQDIRLAWSEGWATFFSAAVRKSSVMVNTRGGDPGHSEHQYSYFFDIEKPHADILTQIGTPLEDHGVYSTSEVAVASVLWDLFDSHNESGDQFALGLRGVWDIFARLMTVPANVSLDTFATYFTNQFGMLGMTKAAELRRVQLFPDEYEDRDDDIALAPPTVVSGQVTCHTLFPAGDVDYVRIQLDQPRAVTVETLNLSNGADTVVELDDEAGNKVVVDGKPLENDNASSPRLFELTDCGNRRTTIPIAYFEAGVNNGARLASTVSTLLPAGVYYAKVMSQATAQEDPLKQGVRNPAASTLGSYDLVVTLQ